MALKQLSASHCRHMGSCIRLGPASIPPNTATVAMRGVATRPIQGRRLGLGKQNVPQHHDIPQYVMGSFPGPAVIFTEHVDGLEAWRRANAMKLGLGWPMKVSWAWPRRRDLLMI